MCIFGVLRDKKGPLLCFLNFKFSYFGGTKNINLKTSGTFSLSNYEGL